MLAHAAHLEHHDAARSDHLGLWADAAPIAPWDWRAAKGQMEYRAKK
jgi:endonuclease YncB( thermonuclease family)